jgi:hypothetical protein
VENNRYFEAARVLDALERCGEGREAPSKNFKRRTVNRRTVMVRLTKVMTWLSVATVGLALVQVVLAIAPFFFKGT